MQRKVLIIDDNKGDMRIIQDLFEEAKLEYKIFWAESGEEGIEVAKKEKPEVIFLDTFLPKLNGFEVCAQLNKNDSSTYIIMMTGSLQDISKLDPQDLLADGFCEKKPSKILREMFRYIEQQTYRSTKNMKINILLVEDNKGDQVLLKETLEETEIDCELSILDKADKIVEFAQKLKPQLILMDVMMSGVTGGDAVRLLRNNAATKDISIVFLTGIYGVEEELSHQKGINVEGHNYPTLSKPVDAKRLAEIVKKYT